MYQHAPGLYLMVRHDQMTLDFLQLEGTDLG